METFTLPDHHLPFLFFPPRNSLEEYFKDSRDIKKGKNPGKCEKQEDQHGKRDMKRTYTAAKGLRFLSVSPHKPAGSAAKTCKI